MSCSCPVIVVPACVSGMSWLSIAAFMWLGGGAQYLELVSAQVCDGLVWRAFSGVLCFGVVHGKSGLLHVLFDDGVGGCCELGWYGYV